MNIEDIVYIPDYSRIIKMKIVKIIKLGSESQDRVVLEGDLAFNVRGEEGWHKIGKIKRVYLSFVVNRYSNFEDTFNRVKADYEKQIKEYRNEINDVKDLLQYPIWHDMSAVEEDAPMYVAYIERSKELLGIDPSIS